MIRSTLSTFTKHTIGRVRRRTSTKQRSMTLVVRSFGHRCRGGEERQQLWQVAFQAAHHGPVLPPPARPEPAKCGLCVGPAFGRINRLRSGLHFVVIALAHVL